MHGEYNVKLNLIVYKRIINLLLEDFFPVCLFSLCCKYVQQSLT
jgi:hypothetical protein